MKHKITFAILLLILVSCAPEPEPKPLVETTYDSHLPVWGYYGQTAVSQQKAGLAWSDMERGWPRKDLGFNGLAHWHNWQWVGDSVGCGGKIPMVWARDKNNFPYLEKFVEWLDYYEEWQGKPYAGCVMWANEPDRPDQANMTVNEVAALYLDMVAACPGCKMIGPGYSSADDGQKVRQVWDRVKQVCGINCPALANWYANNPHHFPIPEFWSPNTRLNIFCDTVYGEKGDGVNTPCRHPNWPTIGYRTCYPNVYSNFKSWLQELEARPDVEKYFIFTTYQEPVAGCQFSAMLDWNSGELTGLGRAVRDVLVPIAYP